MKEKKRKNWVDGYVETLIVLHGEMELEFVKNGKKTRLELETLNLTFIIKLVSIASNPYFFVLIFL
jgi:hypothetical protein